MLIQGKPPLVLSSVPLGAEVELSPVEEGPRGLPTCIWPSGLEGLCWRWSCSGRAQPRGTTPCPPGPPSHWLHSPTPPHPMPRQAGLQPQAQEIPRQPLSHVHRAPGEWSRAWEQWEHCSQPVSPGHCPGCADAPGGLSAFPHLCPPQGAGLALSLQGKVGCVLSLGHKPQSQHFGAGFPPLTLTYCMT